jgi:DNA-binding PadR family transcriptional regulator
MHGHQIKRQAQTDRAELWTTVRPGSLYAALARMAADGVIAVARSEQVGNRPERTVYEVTQSGRAEFASLRDAALRQTALAPDPVDLALQNSFELAPDQLRLAFDSRLSALTAAQIAWQNQWEAAAPYLHGLEPLTFAHTARRLDAEIDWHRQVLAGLDEPAESSLTPDATQEHS